MSISSRFQERFEVARQEECSLQKYLNLCKQDKTAYASIAERLLMTVGGPELLDTSMDSRLPRIFSNKVIRHYSVFVDFHGMEECIDQIVTFFCHAAQGLEEKRRILCLLGPAGGGKSSLAEKLKQLMEKAPLYAIRGSPVFESPLGLFNPGEDGVVLEEDYGIPRHCLHSIMLPWATKHSSEFGGDVNQFRVTELYPSIFSQIAIAKTEPGDGNNQDMPALIDKVDIRKLEEYPQNDADAYSYSGVLCQINQGLVEFVEMFKAPIKALHPLLTATQEDNYNNTEGLDTLPYSDIILAHSSESEWHSFRNDKDNEASINHIYIIEAPHCLRVAGEIKIYDRLLANSSLAHAHCMPDTLKMLSQFSMLSRLKKPESSNIYPKVRVHDGENLKNTDPKAKSIQEYRNSAGVDEGMTGLSTRFAFRILSKVFNFDPYEITTNPVYLLYVLKQQIEQEQSQPETRERYLRLIKGCPAPRYAEFIGKEIQITYLESYSEHGQNISDRYTPYADFWIQSQEYRNLETDEIFNRVAPNEELEKIGKPASISNPKDFHNEIINFVLCARADNNGKNPSWLSYKKLRVVIKRKMSSSTEDLLPVISLSTKASKEDQQKYNDFVKYMVECGYTKKQAHLLSERYLRVRKS